MNPADQGLVDKIKKAFAGVILDGGVSLQMTDYFDYGGDLTEYEQLSMQDEASNWSAIPDEALERFQSTFAFADLKGYRFYLPAYMSWTVRNHDTSDSAIANLTIYAIEPATYQFHNISFAEWFTSVQVSAMIDFLEFAIRNENTLDANVARQNLKKLMEAKKIAPVLRKLREHSQDID